MKINFLAFFEHPSKYVKLNKPRQHEHISIQMRRRAGEPTEEDIEYWRKAVADFFPDATVVREDVFMERA